MPRNHSKPGAIANGIILHRHLIVVILLLCFLGGLAVFLSHGTQLSGDEQFYHVAGKRWARMAGSLLHGAQLDWGAFADRVVAKGWFLPGMGIVLAPMFLALGGDLPVGVLRGYMTAVNLAVIFLIVRGLFKLGVPRGYVWLFLLFSCAIPYYLFFLGAIWGDLLAAHLSILVLITLERSLLSRKAPFGLDGKSALALGLMLGAIAMIRPQYVMLPGIVLARLGVHLLPGENGTMDLSKSLVLFTKVSAIVLLSFAMMLAPWHLALHQKFGTTFMLTSVNLGPLFHNPEFSSAALAKYDTSSKFKAVQQEITALATAAGITFQEQVAIEKAAIEARPSTPLPQRLQRSMKQFYLSENSVLGRFLRIQDDPRKYSGPLATSLLSINSLAWRFLLALGVLALCVPANPRDGNHLAALSLKGLLIMLSLQPLLTTMPHGRYYVGLIPVCALLVALQLRDSPVDTWKRYRVFAPRTAALLAVQVAAIAYGVGNLWVFGSG